ncbi:RloB family protein [Candidatus Saccharibacteria bacterium]|nr:RloB family protein [Candidatus Saccharibacteria bacterium]
MLFVLICTEGEVSEPAYINALKAAIIAQAPQNAGQVEVEALDLQGNQGHTALISRANEKVADYTDIEDSYIGEGDTVEKWIICDYDKMHERGVSIEDLRQDARDAGFELIINRPNFELFILLHFMSIDEAVGIRPSQYETIINQKTDELNSRNLVEKVGFTSAMNAPTYSKNRYHARTYFGQLMSRNPELIDLVASIECDTAWNAYSEMPKIVVRIKEIFESVESE